MSSSSPSSRDTWDLVAEGYAATAVPILQRFAEIALARADVHADHRVVDVACGPGTLARLASSRAAEVHALDYAGAMLAPLRRWAAHEGASNVSVVRADGEALAYASASFDAAFSMFGLMFFADRARGFDELWRVLRPGGRVVVSSWTPLCRSPAMQLMLDAVAAACGAPPPDGAASEGLADPQRFAAEMAACGFSEIDVQEHAADIPIPDVATFWRDMVRGSARLTAMARAQGDTAWARTSERGIANLRAALPQTPTARATRAFIALGRKR